MKYWVRSVLAAAITFIIVFFLKPPFLLFLLVGVPVLTVVITIASFYYSFRSTLQFGPIPQQGYEDRLRALDGMSAEWERQGFARCDGFFLKMIPDSVTYVYKHRQHPTFGLAYHLGAKMSVDLVTRLAGDRSLTTNNSRDAGNIPRPAPKMLQVFPGTPLAGLWDEHQKAAAYLSSKGLASADVSPAEFRPYFLKSLQEFKNYVLRMPFWPVKLVFWVVTRYGQRYCRRIEDQFQSGFLPSNGSPGRHDCGQRTENMSQLQECRNSS